MVVVVVAMVVVVVVMVVVVVVVVVAVVEEEEEDVAVVVAAAAAAAVVVVGRRRWYGGGRVLLGHVCDRLRSVSCVFLVMGIFVFSLSFSLCCCGLLGLARNDRCPSCDPTHPEHGAAQKLWKLYGSPD